MILDPWRNNKQVAWVDLSNNNFSGRLPSIRKTRGFRISRLWQVSVHPLYVLNLRIKMTEVEYSPKHVLEKEEGFSYLAIEMSEGLTVCRWGCSVLLRGNPTFDLIPIPLLWHLTTTFQFSFAISFSHQSVIFCNFIFSSFSFVFFAG